MEGSRRGSAARAQQLTRLSRAFTNARSLDEILQLAVEQTTELLGTDQAVLLLSDDDGLLRVRAAHGIEAEVLERELHPGHDPLSESLVGHLLRLLGGSLTSGFIGVPLVARGMVVGLLASVRRDGTVPTEEDELLLSALADQVAAPLENARLATQLERMALIAENVRLFEAERAARLAAEAAQQAAELARDAAVQADTTKSLFLAAMSHELRTPLNAIGGYVDLLEMGLRGPITTEQAHDLERIKTSQDHLLRLINDVLEYARLGTTQIKPHVDDVDLDAVLREAEIMIVPQAKRKGVTYDYARPAEAITVRADSHLLKQIVLNLLSNAIKFTPRGGAVRLTCEVVTRVPEVVSADSHGASIALRGSVARVSVEDTGRGIPPEQIEAIWQPFVQVGRTLSQPAEGVGLGLAISRDLARRIGGELGVTSIVGTGSIFTIEIPLASAARDETSQAR